MKSKTTKRALLGSVIVMLLCLAMLIGSTFAWFTDSAATAQNTIHAGNLDVNLQWNENGGTTWETVTETTALFENSTLWEPGHTEVVYLKVSNAGTLALKYQLGINITENHTGKTADDKEIDLSKYIYFGVAETATAFSDRTEARNKVTTSAVPISTGYSSQEGHLTAGVESEMLALVVYMPESVGNEANHGTGKDAPSIKFGVSLVATQDTVERDSFDNTYDENAKYPKTVTTVDELKTAVADGGTVVLGKPMELTEAITIGGDTTIVGSPETPIKKQSVNVEPQSSVNFQGIAFADTTGVTNASSVYGQGLKGTVVFENCTFGDNNWESIQITPAGDATIIIRNCTFTATKAMKRFIHIQPAANNNYKLNIVIENCKFIGCENVNYSASDKLSVIDLDYVASGSTMTLGGCTFTNISGSKNTGVSVYFCDPAGNQTYNKGAMYSMLTGAVQTYTVQ